ncbi:MAG: radical SAM protein [bacterium]|nr:radical SAM protein [bacterium]
MKQELDILFVNPPSAFGAYNDTKVKVFRQVFPLLSFMSLSGVLRKEGYRTALLDLGIEDDPYPLLEKCLIELQPHYVGITSTTPLFFEVVEIARIAREKLKDKVIVLYGGPHATALPEDSLKNSAIDIIISGEGEETILEILKNRKWPDIRGITYKENNGIRVNAVQPFIKDLDTLPFPDFSIYDISRYHCSRLVSRGTPVLHMETSRGCPAGCTFCNKNIYGRVFRKKSPERVLEEMKYFIRNGVGEFRIIDDQFATDIERAKQICRLILKDKIRIPWNLANGVRVDRVDEEFLRLAKQAGCYQVGVGFESGDQKALDSIEKGVTLEQSTRCMKLIKKVNIESVGFFIIGLPGDTDETIRKTIRFAVSLMPTFAKTTIAIPFPGTRMYEQYEQAGRIKSKDWSKYNIHKVADIYEHPSLTQAQLRKYYELFYRKFYLNYRFLWMRLVQSIREGTFFQDIYYGFKTFIYNK